MAEHEIPPPFRALFGGPALVEPAPPPPVEPSDKDGGPGDGHHHFHFRVAIPKLIVLSDGSTRTDGWAGSLLVGWGWLASFVTVWAAGQAVSAYVPMLLFSILAAVAMVVLWITLGAFAEVQRAALVRRWQRRKARPS